MTRPGRLPFARSASSVRALYGKTEDQYLNLVRKFPLRPLRTEADLESAIGVIDTLIDRPALTSAE